MENGASLDYPVFHDSVSEAVPVAPPVSGSRIDTVQVQAALEEYDEQRRAFFNPETESSQYYQTPTKKRLAIKCEIKRGVEGQDVAPETDAGWLKLAEILVEPGVTGIAADDIKCVTAIYENEENAEWTLEKTRTFILGSDLALKTMLAKEHTITGEHRANVIHASNIDFGIGNNQVNGTVIPTGDSITIEGTGYPGVISITDILKVLADRNGGGSSISVFDIDQNGHLIMHYDGSPFDMIINDNGHLLWQIE